MRGENGKPELAGGGIHFSLSTSDSACVIALAERGPIGVDIERVVPRAGLERIARRRFTPAEADAILAREPEGRLRAFYECWTAKEAYLKATGTGLAGRLDSVVFAVGEEDARIVRLADGDPSDWRAARLDLGDDLAGTLVTPRRPSVPSA